jgi:hypothetical protein
MNSSPTSSPKSNVKAKFARRLGLACALGLAVGLLGLGGAQAYLRIVINGRILAWSAPGITWNLHVAGSDDIDDGSHEMAIVKAFDVWQSVGGSKIAFARGADVSSGPSSSNHVVMFDENNDTGYFPPLSGIVALTPISYDTGSGNILDADIIFNGKDYSWSTAGDDGHFDVQDVLTHELGHFIGLDHSPVLSGSMWPYVSPKQWLHRSLSLDDRSGAIAVAEQPNQTRILGTVRRSGDPVPGATVCVINADDGRLTATTLTSEDGSWVIKGVPVGNYQVYACPLEGGMSEGNLTGNGLVSVNFSLAFYGGFGSPTTFSIAGGGSVNCGNLAVPANSPVTESNSSPMILRRGQVQFVTVFGSGFTSGGMDFLTKSPYLSVSAVNSSTTWARALITVAAGTPYGQYDVYVRNPAGDLEAATGLLDVVAPAPQILVLSAPTGVATGGQDITITGTGFQNGAYVLFGGVEALEVQFVDSTSLIATTPSHAPGGVSLAIHNPDGQQTELTNAFTFTAQPEFNQLFPTAGQSSGGTTLLINGGSFAPDMEVELDGQSLPVTWLSARLVRVVTPAHAIGSVDLLLRNPGETETPISDAFQFVAEPDPRITEFTPNRGPKQGGTRVRLKGEGLNQIVEVRFGVDSISALGGVNAASIDILSAARMDAVTANQPAAGTYGLVAITASGQAAFVQGFTFEGSDSANPGGSGMDLGGGGCAGNIGGRRADARTRAGDAFMLALWIGGFLLLRRRRLG